MQFTIGLLIGLIAGAIGIYTFLTISGRKILTQAKPKPKAPAAPPSSKPKNRAKEIELKSKAEQLRLREQFEKENESARVELKNAEQRLTKREDIFDKKLDTLATKERHLEDLENRIASRQKSIEAKETQVTDVLNQQRERLMQIATSAPIRRKKCCSSASKTNAARMRRVDPEAHRAGAGRGQGKSRQIILQAIQRYAADQTATTPSAPCRSPATT